MSANYFNLIKGIVDRMVSSDGAPARFSYNQNAFDTDQIEGVDPFSLAHDQNVPTAAKTGYSPSILDRGIRTRGISISREGYDHFIGRVSYNISKIAQKFSAFIGGVVGSFAHNAFEYDSTAAYLTGDVVMLIGLAGTTPSLTYWERTGVVPTTITNVSPLDIGQTDWAEIPVSTSLNSILPMSAPGYRHKYTLVDLTGGSYLTTTWYPVTSEPFPTSLAGTDYIRDTTMDVEVQAFTLGAVIGVTGTALAELSLVSRFTGWLSSSVSTVMHNLFIKVSDGTTQSSANNPIGYSVLPIGKQAVIWLLGGSKYGIWDNFGGSYTVRTAAYNNGSDAPISPVTAAPGVSVVPAKWRGLFSTVNTVNSDEVVNLSQTIGDITQPITLTAGQDLNTLASPGVYVATSTIGSSLVNPPIATLGACIVVVSGDILAASISKQLLIQVTSGIEWTRIMAGGVIIFDWYVTNGGDTVRKTKSFVLPTIGANLKIHADSGTVVVSQGTVDDCVYYPTVGASTKGVNGKLIVPNGAKMTLIRKGTVAIPGSTPVKIPNPATLPAFDSYNCVWSPDGRYMMVGSANTPFITIYDWATGVPVKISDPAVLPASAPRGAWSPDGRYIAAVYNTSPYLIIYSWVTGAPVKIADPAVMPPNGAIAAAWSPDGRYLAVTLGLTPFIVLYDWVTGAPVNISGPAILPTGIARSVAWTYDGRYMAVAHINTPFISVYDWASGTPVKIANPAALPAFDAYGCSWSPDGRYLAVGCGTTPFIAIYDWVTGVPVKMASPAIVPTGLGEFSDWSPDGRYLAISHVSSPYVTIYDWITGVPVKITNPVTLPALDAFGAAWSPNGRYLAIAHVNSPYITIYDTAVQANNTWLIEQILDPQALARSMVSPRIPTLLPASRIFR